jgi:hypothetical protein
MMRRLLLPGLKRSRYVRTTAGTGFGAYVEKIEKLIASALDLPEPAHGSRLDLKSKATLHDIGESSAEGKKELTAQCAHFRKHPIISGEASIQKSFVEDCERLAVIFSRLSEVAEKSTDLRLLTSLNEELMYPGWGMLKFRASGSERVKRCAAIDPDGGQLLTARGSGAASVPCTEAIGPVRAEELASRCNGFDDAPERESTCVATNPCPVLIDEFKRGCGMFLKESLDDLCKPYAGRPCRETAGSRHAQELINRCLDVSPATHPPCNAHNPCTLIQSEIKRGCGFLPKETAPSYCRTQ